MDTNNPHMLEERLGQLPEDVRNAVLSVEWEGKVQAIGAKHRLHIDQIGALGDLTLMAMIGLVNLSDYPARMAEDLKIPAADAQAITTEVGDEVFMPIRESLKKLSSPRGASAATPPVPSMAMPTPGPATSNVAPSPIVTPKPVAPVPAAAAATVPVPIVPKAPIPAALAPKPDLSAADALLSATTVTTVATPATPAAAPVSASAQAGAEQPPKPASYATDPYREPPV